MSKLHIRHAIAMYRSGKYKPIDVWHYLVGNYRYWLYYSANKVVQRKPPLTGEVIRVWYYRHWLMRSHIYDQIQRRFEWADSNCIKAEACKLCGCATPQLQMAAKACDKPCYPPLMRSSKWKDFIAEKESFIEPIDKVSDRVWIVIKKFDRKGNTELTPIFKLSSKYKYGKL